MLEFSKFIPEAQTQLQGLWATGLNQFEVSVPGNTSHPLCRKLANSFSLTVSRACALPPFEVRVNFSHADPKRPPDVEFGENGTAMSRQARDLWKKEQFPELFRKWDASNEDSLLKLINKLNEVRRMTDEAFLKEKHPFVFEAYESLMDSTPLHCAEKCRAFSEIALEDEKFIIQLDIAPLHDAYIEIKIDLSHDDPVRHAKFVLHFLKSIQSFLLPFEVMDLKTAAAEANGYRSEVLRKGVSRIMQSFHRVQSACDARLKYRTEFINVFVVSGKARSYDAVRYTWVFLNLAKTKREDAGEVSFRIMLTESFPDGDFHVTHLSKHREEMALGDMKPSAFSSAQEFAVELLKRLKS